MSEFLIGHHTYWFVLILSTIGIYGMMFKKNLFKKIIGMGIFQFSIIVFWLLPATKNFATVPIFDPQIDPANHQAYLSPLPHTLMLTAIVVGVATTGVGLALLIKTYKNYQTLDEDDLIQKIHLESKK